MSIVETLFLKMKSIYIYIYIYIYINENYKEEAKGDRFH